MNSAAIIQQATALLDAGRAEQAEALIRRLLRRKPNHAASLCALGQALQAKGDVEAATSAYARAVALQPDSPACLRRLGELQLGSEEFGEAESCFRRALAIAPNDGVLHARLGQALHLQGAHDAALAAYRQALVLDDEIPIALDGIGAIALAREEFGAAAATFEQLLRLAPDLPEAIHNLGEAYFQLGRVDEAIEQFRRCMQLQPTLEQSAQAAIATAVPGSDAADHGAMLCERRAMHELARGAASPVAISKVRSSERLRIGYLSSFFQHRNWMKPVWGLINQHDRKQFEVVLLSDAAREQIGDEYRAGPRDEFVDLSGTSNREAAELIARKHLDLLVDLNGYSKVGRVPLPLHRPAPATVAWFNSFCTSGGDAVDYLIGDAYVVRHDEEAFYTERIVRIAGSYLTFEVGYPVPNVAESPWLRSGRFTFGSLAPLYKITPRVMAAWGKILAATGDSRLLLKSTALANESNRAFVEARFRELGVDAARLDLRGPAEHYEFLQSYDEIDVALDTFPYNGGTTTIEAIWQGVPVVAFDGDRWASRTSASILRAAGLDQLVAANEAAYIDLAIRCATDAPLRERIASERLETRERVRASSVCDTAGFARRMEALYRQFVAAGAR